MSQYISEYGWVLQLAILLFVSSTILWVLILEAEKKNLKGDVLQMLYHGKRLFLNPLIAFIFPFGLIVFSFVDYFLKTCFLPIFVIVWFLFMALNRLFGKVVKVKAVNTISVNQDGRYQQNIRMNINSYNKTMKCIYLSICIVTLISLIIFISTNIK